MGEEDSTMNQSYCIRNKGNLQNLFRATPILFRATFNGVDNLSRVEKIIKKKVKMEKRKGGKEKGFQCGTYSLKTINRQHVLT